MTQNPFSFFEDIVCINLEERNERRQGTQEVWDQIGVGNKGRFHIVKRHSKGGMYGCFDSHIQCIKKAYDDGHKNILIFEDDIKLSPSYSTKQVQDCVNFMKAQDGNWDTFFMGYFPVDSNRGSLAGLYNAKFHTDNVIGFAPLGTHCLCVSRSGMKKILDKYESAIGKTHYDMFLISLKLNSFCIVPCLFDQRLCLETDNSPLDSMETFVRKFQCTAERTNLMYKPTLIKYNLNKYRKHHTKKIVIMIALLLTLAVMVGVLRSKR